MNYKEVSFTFEPVSNEGREIIAALLSQINFESFADSKTGLNAYIPVDIFNEEEMNDVLLTVKETFDSFSYTLKTIEEQNWNETWEKNFEPIFIEDKCCIRAPFHQVQSSFLYDIIIEPKMSFGTGHHATTALIIKLMLRIDFQNKTVLDMGCGTGVLGILASKKNAKSVVGIDIDNWSYENTMENNQRNQVTNFEVLLGDASFIMGKSFDVILANINRNILLNDMEIYVNALNKGSLLLLSGFYTQDLPIISEKASKLGLKYIQHLEQENWVAVQFIRND